MHGNGNGRPLGIRKTIRLLIALTILCWATQTLLAQWGLGADVRAEKANLPGALAPSPAGAQRQPAESFVPAPSRGLVGATLELRSEATIVGEEVKLKQVCRWSQRDEPVFSPIADLTLVRLSSNAPFRKVTVAEVKGILHEAGVNLSAINFAGAAVCMVDRSDKRLDEGEALQQWIDASEAAANRPLNVAATAGEPATQPAAAAASEVAEPPSGVKTLRQFLVADAAQRLNLPQDSLQLTFSPKDEKVLNLAEPQFRFDLEPVRVRNLGPVAWDVSIFSGPAPAGSEGRKVSVGATARAWQDQVVLTRPLSHRQLIREEDVVERRALVDQLPEDHLLRKEQVVGQQCARELKPGAVMTARLVEAVPLVRSGQFVTITLHRGSVRIRTVARAMDEGAFGQTIRVKNEATKDVYEVVVTGPQAADMTPPPGNAAPTNVATLGRD